MNKNAKFINTTSPSSMIFIYDAEVVLAFIFVAFIYYLHCGKILLRVKQNRKLISLNLSCMHFLFRNAVYTKKIHTKKVTTSRRKILVVSGFLTIRYFLCQKSKKSIKKFWLEGKMDGLLEWIGDNERVYFEKGVLGLWLPNRWTVQRIRRSTKPPTNHNVLFFLVSSSELLLVLPSRLLKEACLTGTLELFR